MTQHGGPGSEPRTSTSEQDGINRKLLQRYKTALKQKFPNFLERILKSSAEHGVFGLDLLDSLHEKLPRTTCKNCGRCCNAVSIYSLEYHRLMRDIMTRFDPARLRRAVYSVLRFDLRFAEVGEERRVRCVFRDEETKVCLVHSVRPFPCRLFGLPRPGEETDCPDVLVIDPSEKMSVEEREALQTPIYNASELIRVAPGEPPVAFFPIEFWMLKAALGTEQALRIYREILVPASTPLSRFWNKAEDEVSPNS